MGMILISLALGLLTGRLFRQLSLEALLGKLEKAFLPTLTLMVFFLALSVASGDAHWLQMKNVLLNAVLITLGSMVGSMLIAITIQKWLCTRILFATRSIKKFLLEDRRHGETNGSSVFASHRIALRAGYCIAAAFAGGLIIGFLHLPIISHPEITQFGKNLTLQAVMILVGVNLGSDRRTLRVLRNSGPCILILPLAIIIGTLMGAITVSTLLRDITWVQAMSISSGLGFYSASSSIISNLAGPVLGLTALMVNLLREILTLVLGPHVARFFGPVGPIACGGATTMNSTLPMISLASGKDYIVLAFCSGLILSLLVPVLVTVILQIH